MKQVYLAVFIVLLLAAALSAAQPESAVRRDRSSLPITIKSNELSADNKGKTAIFTGRVVAKQGDITIHADKVVINYGDKKGEVEKIEASGNVRILQANRTGSAAEAVYDSREGKITLTGSPKVVQGSDTLSGKVITYFIDEDRSVVKGGEDSRVEAVIHPPPRKGAPGAKP